MKYVRLRGCTRLHKVSEGYDYAHLACRPDILVALVGVPPGDHFTDTIPDDARLCRKCRWTEEEKARGK